MDLNDMQLYRELTKRNLKYTMTNMLSLELFKGATWDIFRLHGEIYTHLRVTGVHFGTRYSWPFVKSFVTRKQLIEDRWVDVATKLDGLFFENIGGSCATHNADGNLMLVVMPRNCRNKRDWIGAVFYPATTDVSDPLSLQVIGWNDRINPIYNFDMQHLKNIMR